MSSAAFSFVPRAVSKVKRKQYDSSASTSAVQPAPTAGSQSVLLDATSPGTPLRRPSKPPTSDKSKYSDDAYAALICLALSYYALWADPDLRRMLELKSDLDSSEEGEGFFPLSYLLKGSKLMAPLKLEESELPIAKALRSHAADVFEVRLLISDPASSLWSGGYKGSRDVGAYEIRKKYGADSLSRLSKADWERRTIYVENIPVQFKTIPAIMFFILALLAEHPSSTPALARLQNIAFPPHHQDKPGDQPTFKGFALLILKDEHDVDYLLQRWPWGRQHTSGAQTTKTDLPKGQTDVQEALKFGFRALSKRRWDELKDEYLSYRGRLVAEINTHQHQEPTAPAPQVSPAPAPAPDAIATREIERIRREDSDRPAPTLNFSSPYPFNSLVFVRNIHLESNKTTLRKFFASAFGPSLASGDLQGDGLDYVDFNKGMDSCHVRLATPRHAQILVDHFHRHPTLHSHGLDEVGVLADAESHAVSMELVTGRREALYWEKVPEKVRRQAVQKALASLPLQGPSSADAALSGGGGGAQANDDTRKRKRRKR